MVLTFDLDFGELLARGQHQLPSVIIFRLHDERPDNVTEKLFEVVGHCRNQLAQGAIVIVEDDRYRVRMLPIGRA